MVQRFKANDVTESQVYNLFLPTLELLGVDRDTFFEEAFETYGLGEALYATQKDPLTDVVTLDVYRTGYPAIHELFTRPGTFEFYLSVFRKVFTENTDIQFTIPGPGRLHIEIDAVNLEEFNILTREIVEGEYVYSTLVTSDTSDPIMAQGVVGLKTQAEIENLLTEISAYGVYTTVELVEAP